MTRILVTGAGSFTARFLLEALAGPDSGNLVTGTDLAATGPAGIDWVAADLTDREAVRHAVAKASPQQVFHLAGIVSADADRCFAVNLEGTRNLLDACARLPSPPAVLVISSAAVYGLSRPDESPVIETTPLRPVSPYGASKAAMEMAALSLHRQGRLPVTVARPFNLVGPGLTPGLAPSDFAAQVRAIRNGGAGQVLRVGNLAPRRDFVDVRDAVRAYMALAAEPGCRGGVYNVGTGRAVTIRALLDGLIAAAGITVRVEPDPARVRAVDVEEQVADLTAIRRALGWEPSVPLADSLRDMVGMG